MTTTTYSNISANAQSTIYNVLASDSTVVSYVQAGPQLNIYDGFPDMSVRSGKSLFILIRSPNDSEDWITLRKKKATITCEIEVYGTKEGDVRLLSDAVRQALRKEHNTFKNANMMWQNVESTNITPTFLTGEQNQPVWTRTIIFSFMWSGEYD
ncbi:MAG: hypothetical protein ACTSXD_08555 [Candidatus Heimdallarchaeaceae archaeon]